MSNEIGKQTAPFTIFSSSATGGYLTDLHSNFTGSVEINNLHSDEYGQLVGAPLQGPYTYQWVGGHQHRHQEVFSTTNRGESYNLSLFSGSLKVLGSDSLESINTVPSSNQLLSSSIFSSDPMTANSFFGVSVRSSFNSSTSALYTLAGARTSTQNKAFLFKTAAGTNTQLSTIEYPGGTGDGFGYWEDSIDIVSGSDALYMLIGAVSGDTAGSNRGDAMLLKTSDDGATVTHWDGTAISSTVPILTASDSQSNDSFGRGVSVVSSSHGVFSLVGAPYEDTNASGAGSVYLFRTYEGATSEICIVRNPDSTANANFGKSVSMVSGSDAIYCAIGAGGHNSNTGRAYIYKFTGNDFTTPTLISTLTASDEDTSRYFGDSTSIASSSYGIYTSIGTSQGSRAYLYKTLDGTTSEVSALTASTSPGDLERFGNSVSVSALSNGIVYTVVGAWQEEASGNRTDSGLAFLFRTYNDITTESVILQSVHDPTNFLSTNDRFGNSIHIVPNSLENNLYITVGEWGSDHNGSSNSYVGAVNIFKYSSATEQESTITQDTSLPRADYTRDTLAKRSLNISNIRTNTGSISVGNYDHNIQVVQTTGKTQNPRHFAENSENYQQFAEKKGSEGNVLNSLNDVGTLRNFALPTGSANKSIITNKFSAPGDRYTMSKGFLNPSGEEMSVYNSLPYRNENVRLNLRDSLSRHMSAQGYEVSGSTITITGSFHKVNRNTLRQLEGGYDGTLVTTGSVKDNFYVQHPIPRSDLSYAWVTASISSTAMDSLYGYQKNSNDISFDLPTKDLKNFEHNFNTFDHNPAYNDGFNGTKHGTAQQTETGFSIAATSGSEGIVYVYGAPAHSLPAANTGRVMVAKNTYDEGSPMVLSDPDIFNIVLTHEASLSGQRFGQSVDVVSGTHGVYIVAGSPWANDTAPAGGSAALFRYDQASDNTGITRICYFTGSLNTDSLPNSAGLGYQVSVTTGSSGLFIAVAAPFKKDESTTFQNAGSIYVYKHAQAHAGYSNPAQLLCVLTGSTAYSTATQEKRFGWGLDTVSGSDGIYLSAFSNTYIDKYVGGAEVWKITDTYSYTTPNNAERICLIIPPDIDDGNTGTPASSNNYSGFGISTSIVSGSAGIHLLVGDPEHSSKRGKVYLFSVETSGETLLQSFTTDISSSHSGTAAPTHFGSSVSMISSSTDHKSGLYMAMGAPGTPRSSAGPSLDSQEDNSYYGNVLIYRHTEQYGYEKLDTLGNPEGWTNEYGFGNVVKLIEDVPNERLWTFVGNPDSEGSGTNRGRTYEIRSDNAIDFSKPTMINKDSKFVAATNTKQLSLTSSGPMSGAYGFSSWEAMRRTDYKSTRYIRDNNLFSFWTSDNRTYENTTVVTQSAITSKYKPIQHTATITGDESNTPFTFRSTYSNDLSYFSDQKNTDVEAKLGLYKDDDETFYATVKGYYIQPESDNTNNPFGTVSKVRVSETVYPKDKSAYTVGTRARSNYSEVAGTGENGYDRQYGKQNTFYHPSKLRSTSTKNSFGFVDSDFSPIVTEEEFTFGDDLLLPSTLSSVSNQGLLLDTASGSVAFRFGDPSESGLVTRTLETTFEVTGTVSISFDIINGDYTPLSLTKHGLADARHDLKIEYDDGTGWKQAYVSGSTGQVVAATASIQNISSGIPTAVENLYSHVGTFQGTTKGGVDLSRFSGTGFTKPSKLRFKQDGSNNFNNWAIRNLVIKYTEGFAEASTRGFFPLQTSGVNSFPLSGTYDQRNGELMVDNDQTAYTANPIPSQCFVESTSLVKDRILSDYLERTTNTLAGVNPWEDSYDDYREDFRGTAKDMSVLPEFKISDHLDEYYADFNFARPPTDYLTLQGGDISKGEVTDTGAENFFDRFTTSEPLRDYKQFLEDHAEEGLEIKSMKIKVDTVKKLLPYNGFYPMTRTVQLGNLLSASFIENVTGKEKGVSGFDTQGFQAISKTLMSPGILYNSVKAGYGVSYPIYKTTPTTKMDTRAVDKNVYEDFHIESAPDYQIPFDALLNPKGNIPENEDIIFTPSWTSTTPAAPAYDYSGQWNGTAKPQFQLGMHNFLAETVKFFLKDEQLVSHVSEPQKEGFDVEAGKTYYMDVVLRDNLKMDRMGTYSGTVKSSADSWANDSLVWDVCSGSDGFYMVTRNATDEDETDGAGLKPKISLFKRTLDPEPWKLIDSFTYSPNSHAYTSPVSIASGSSEIFVAVRANRGTSRTSGTMEEVRVYKYRNGSFDQDNYDVLSPSEVPTAFIGYTPTTDSEQIGRSIKLVSMSDGGYSLATTYMTATNSGAWVPRTFNITSSAGFGSSTTTITVGGSGYGTKPESVILLYGSSSAGLVEKNIFHNVNPDRLVGNNDNQYSFASGGTIDMVSASYVDTEDAQSSSFGGLIIVAGDPLAKNGSSHHSGSLNLYYSGSVYGTSSFCFTNNFPTSDISFRTDAWCDDRLGSRVAVANNSSAPDRRFYVAASTQANRASSSRLSGSIQFYTGSFLLSADTATPTGFIPQINFGSTFTIDDDYFVSSSFNETKEFGSGGSLCRTATPAADRYGNFGSIGNSLSLVSSDNGINGKKDSLYLLSGNPCSLYDHGTEDTIATGSLILFTIDANGFSGGDTTGGTYGNFAFLPVRVQDESGMSRKYNFGGETKTLNDDADTIDSRPIFTADFGSGVSGFKIISCSANPYTAGGIATFTSDFIYKMTEYTEKLMGSADPTDGYISNKYRINNPAQDRTFVIMHTGSSFETDNDYTGSYSAAATREISPNFTASVQISSDFTYRKDGALYGQPVENAYDPAYSAYTPPSFYGTSVARISYTAPEYGGKVSLPEIFRDATVQEIFELDTNRTAKFYSKTNTMTALQKSAKMPLSSSVTLFGARIPRVDNAFDPRDVQWVIGSKFESPVLDFAPNDTAHSSSYTARNQALMNSLNFVSNASHLPPRSMWTSYGSIPSNEKGITLEVKESYDQGILNSPTTGSLVELCGFKAQSKKMGQVSTSKEISEAIVLIPYVKGGFGPSGIGNGSKAMKRAFKFANSSAEVSARSASIKQFTNSHSFIPIKASTFNSQFKKLQDGEDPETTITKMIQGMEKYILPPHMDFLKAYKKNDNKWTGSPLLPFAMYFVEVDHDLDQEDLLNIWQGVMPKIARDFDGEEMSQVLEHDIDDDNLFHKPDLLKRAIKQDLSFMVFKVKQKAEANYFNVTKDSIDDLRYQFDFDGDGIREAVPEYSYNWPYDFFSLIETAKVTIDLDLEEIPEPVVVNTVTPPPPPFRTLRPTRTLRPRDRIQRGRLQRTRIKQKVKRKLNKPRASVRDKIKTSNRPKVKPRIRGVR